MRSRIAGHVRAHVVGYIALFLAMSGTAYAVGANSIGDRELANNSVGSSEIEPQSVKSSDIKDDAIGEDQLGYGGDCGYVGQILRVGFNFAPEGTIPADGRLLPINQFQALYSLFGTTYGGNGQNTFQMPKLTSADGQTIYVVCNNGIYPPRP